MRTETWKETSIFIYMSAGPHEALERANVVVGTSKNFRRASAATTTIWNCETEYCERIATADARERLLPRWDAPIPP